MHKAETLHEKCPNTELFLVRIFLYFDWIQFCLMLGLTWRALSLWNKTVRKNIVWRLFMPLLNASIFVFQYFDDDTARKVSKYGVISGPYFSVFELNTEIYSVNLRNQSKYRKIRTRNNSVFGHFSHSVILSRVRLDSVSVLSFTLFIQG